MTVELLGSERGGDALLVLTAVLSWMFYIYRVY